MLREFNNKVDLLKFVKELDKNKSNRILLIDDLTGDENNDFYSYELPEEVKNFFKVNCSRYLNILHDLPEPFFIKDANSNWFYVNKAFCKFLNVSYKDIYGKKSNVIFSDSVAGRFEAQDTEVIACGKESVVEQQITTTKGGVYTVLSKKNIFYDSEHKAYIIGIFNEITKFRDSEIMSKYEKDELEKEVEKRTFLLNTTIERLQDEAGKRKITEAALLQSEDKFRNVIEQSVEGIMLNDSQGRIIEWNESMYMITGVSAEKAIGKYHWDVEFEMMHPGKKTPEFYQKLKNNSLIALEFPDVNKSDHNIEGKIYTPDGIEKYIYLSSFGIKTQNNFYIGRIVRDITEQKKAVLELERSENQYRTIFENSSVAILIIDPVSNTILNANEKASEMYFFSIDELKGMNYTKLCQNYESDKQQLMNIEKNIPCKDFESVHHNKKGVEINIIINGSVIEYGGIQAIMNFYRDITSLKHTEKVRDTIFKISQLIHTSKDVEDLYKSIHIYISELIKADNFYIALYDEDNDFITFPYFVDKYDEKPKPRKLRRGITEYVLRHGSPVLLTPLMLKQLQMSGEIEMIGPMSAKWLGVPLITQNKVIGVIAIQSYEEEVNFTTYDKDLLSFVSEQIAALIYKKNSETLLIKAKEKAEESNRLKTSLIANMNHELRTPMTGILGFASLLKSKAKDPESLNMVDNILESGNRLMNTLNSIIQISQFEASKKQLDIISTDINRFVDMAVISLEPEAHKKGLTIIKKYHEQKIASFNENYILQVFKNLINNAINYTEKGSITIKTGYSEQNEKGYVYISFIDTGIGISREDYQMIFEEFRQVSEGLNRKYSGSGLGLSLSKKMVELMKGFIIVESTLGKGSAFTVYIPAAPHSLITMESSESEIKKTKKKSGKKIKYKILVVDDNKVNGELINAYLKNNFEVDIATTGMLAIELVKRSDYNIVLMDINLESGMSGIQAAAEIQSMNDKLPIIAMTAYSTEEEIEKIMKKYFVSFVLKPIDKTSLQKVISNFLTEATEN